MKPQDDKITSDSKVRHFPCSAPPTIRTGTGTGTGTAWWSVSQTTSQMRRGLFPAVQQWNIGLLCFAAKPNKGLTIKLATQNQRSSCKCALLTMIMKIHQLTIFSAQTERWRRVANFGVPFFATRYLVRGKLNDCHFWRKMYRFQLLVELPNSNYTCELNQVYFLGRLILYFANT